MLIDYIPIDQLPFFIIWLDWCFYAYSNAFGILCSLALWRCIRVREKAGTLAINNLLKDCALSFSLGFVAWFFYCLYWQGWAVG